MNMIIEPVIRCDPGAAAADQPQASRTSARARRMPPRSAESGFVMLTTLMTMLFLSVIGVVFMTSLMGEIQGEFAYHQSVSALSVAEAGLHWAGNRLTDPTAATYTGDLAQTVQGAGGQQVGVFDVLVRCNDANQSVPKPPNDPSPGCSVLPTQRLIIATGYVPSNSNVQAQRKVQALVNQSAFGNKTLCAYHDVTLHQGVTVKGNVGSEGSSNFDINLQSPPDGMITASPDGSQKGDAYAVTNVLCQGGQGQDPCNNHPQYSGNRFPGQTPGKVCPNHDTVRASFVCTPGGSDFSGGALTITKANATYGDIDIPPNSNLTFVTTGPADVLTVQINSISVGQNGNVIVQGGGTVLFTVKSQMNMNSIGGFNVDPGGILLDSAHMVVRSCNTGVPAPAVEFNLAAKASGTFLVPDGTVHLNQTSLSKGAILADTIDVEQDTAFSFDQTVNILGTGFNHLLSWQDVP